MACPVTAASLEERTTSLSKLCGFGVCREIICLIVDSKLSCAPVPAHGIKLQLTV